MEISFMWKGKGLIMPKFKILYNDSNKEKFAIAICPQDESEAMHVENTLNAEETFVNIRGTVVYFEALTEIYFFDFGKDFEILPKDKSFKIGVVFVDKDDNIISGRYGYYTVNLNNYENNNRH